MDDRGGCYTGMNVTTGIMLCHDMHFAIPLHIHGFHWMDRQRYPHPPPRAVITASSERDAPLDQT